jgi:hypothetical protein
MNKDKILDRMNKMATKRLGPEETAKRAADKLAGIANKDPMHAHKIFHDVLDLSVPRGKQKALKASDALKQHGWRQWLSDRENQLDRASQFKRMNSIAGHIIDLNDFNQQEFIIECYEEYLRMAHLNQSSKVTMTTMYVAGKARMIGKPIIDMSFEDYLNDCLINLRWRMTKDLPAMRERDRMGYIGVEFPEYEKTMQLCKLCEGGIKKYLELPANKRLIYV